MLEKECVVDGVRYKAADAIYGIGPCTGCIAEDQENCEEFPNCIDFDEFGKLCNAIIWVKAD